MRAAFLLPIPALLLIPALLSVAPPAQALSRVEVGSPAPRSGDILVALSFDAETDAAWAALAKLGWRLRDEQRVMMALPNGRRGCVAVFRGFLPAASLAAARRVAGVQGVHPLPAGAR